ncbi:Cystathionine beta-lyase [Chromobacterium violaceum]|uniref:Cystathionine beta-lyase n=1 Tax=Chromobacterium violaceum TaxID=536 RepID=A0A447TI54_CHRVL|nr:Cystathionine beta-lyase [Chromobacterium violaceum]
MTDFHTLAVTAGAHEDPFGAVMPPIYATSTYRQHAPGEHTGYEYSRSQNPTREALERAVAELEGGIRGYAFGSGLAAISTVLELLPAGSHLIAVNDLYGGTYRLFEKVRKASANLEVTYVASEDSAALEAAIRPNTRMIWVETPSNPLNQLVDLQQVSAIARRHKLIGVVDNTFASPVNQRPLDFGFDIVVHSATKYLNGHSDVVAGVAVVSRDQPALAEQLAFLHNAVGAILDAFPASWCCAACARWRCASSSTTATAWPSRAGWRRSPGWRKCCTRAWKAIRSTRWRAARCRATAASCRSISTATSRPSWPGSSCSRWPKAWAASKAWSACRRR